MEIDTHPGRTLRLFLFENVDNSGELLKLLQSGTLVPEVALFNAALVPSVFPILASAHKSLVAQSRGQLITRTLHSELVYNYSGSKNITESFRRCGISASTRYVLVCQFDCPQEKVEDVKNLIKGAEIGLEELGKKADVSLIQQHYKITAMELEVSSLSDSVTSRIAARDAL